MTESGKITIRDVARRAGVSLGTASRAMNAAPGVMARTRATVEAAARELGYQPNAAARALRSRSSRLIGCLFTDLENPLYARLYNSLQDRMAEEGFVTLINASSGRADRESRAVQTFAERGLDAIVVAPGNETDADLLALLRDFPAPIVVVDRDIEIGADRVLFDHDAGIRAAVSYLAGLGHRRILPVFSPIDTRPGRMRSTAFDAAMAEAGLDVPLRVAPDTPNSPVFAEVCAALAGPDRATAMIVQGTHVLSSALNALARLGLRVPEDMSLIAIGDSATTTDHVPALTALRLDRDGMVALIADRLLARIRGLDGPRQDDVIAYELVKRGSCMPPA
ncbi:transcriptional regulator [Primorskyibacter flagellatus]|uniref:Transcriptional regulator n=1 Tax=Primorskyibacter flagellatus TaxID=1387277 RepID=A0A917EC86_9RHOB|nr:LacI family DNA-binding transcriptional regulator [Primorskyibacter flagellatus]GGE23081.1 transcriptional regulator [Primorskyibacter flagellatus]